MPIQVLKKQLLAIRPVRTSYWSYVQHKKHHRAEVLFVSFPKAGRTWLRVLIGKVLSEKYNKEFTIELEQLADEQIPNILMTHDGANIPDKPLETSKRKYRHKKVVFLARDPRDTVVSYYFQRSRRRMGPDGKPVAMDMSAFVRDDRYGIDRIVNFMNIWAQNQQVFRDFLLVRYEDLHRNPSEELRKILEFIGIPEVAEELISKAVSFGSFDNMVQMERAGVISSDRLRAKNPDDREAYKVRRGKVRGYADYLSADDIEYSNNQIRGHLDKKFGYE